MDPVRTDRHSHADVQRPEGDRVVGVRRRRSSSAFVLGVRPRRSSSPIVLADRADHRRGLICACGDAAGVDCIASVHTSVCAAACDGSDGPSGDNQPVPSTTLSNRTISLHLDNPGLA
ncbi:hypothetical protein OG809_39115 [Kribbella soli]